MTTAQIRQKLDNLYWERAQIAGSIERVERQLAKLKDVQEANHQDIREYERQLPIADHPYNIAQRALDKQKTR